MTDIGSILTTVIFALVVIGALRGITGGFLRSLIRTGCTIAAAVAAYSVTLASEAMIIASVTPDKIKEFLVGLGEAAGPVNFAGFADYLNSLDLFVALPGAFIAPIAFVLVFLGLRASFGAASAIVCGILGIPKGGQRGEDVLIGSALGAIEGVAIAAVICIPVSGLLGLAGDSVEVMREKNDEKFASIIATYDESIAPLNEHFAMTAAKQLGADAIMDSFTTVNLDGEEINLRSEFVNVVDIVTEFATIGEIDFTALSEDNKLAIRSAVDSLENSDYLMRLASGIISDMGSAIEDGVVPISVPAPYDVVLHPAITMLATSNIDNFKADLDTILEIYYLLSDSGVLKAFGIEGQEQGMANAFVMTDANGDTVINQIVSIIDKNEHMRPLVKALTDMSLIMLTNQLGIDADIVEVYDNVKTGVNEVLAVRPEDYDTEEEYVAARNEKLDETLNENGIELEPDVVDGIGDFIDENYPDHDELTDEEFNDIILSYYDVYKNLQTETP